MPLYQFKVACFFIATFSYSLIPKGSPQQVAPHVFIWLIFTLAVFHLLHDCANNYTICIKLMIKERRK